MDRTGLEAARAEHAARLAKGGWRPVDVAPRTFRYAVPRRSLVVSGVVGAALLAAGVGLLAMGLAADDAVVRWLGLVLGSVQVLLGLFVLVAVRRSSRSWISVDAEGIRAHLLFRRHAVPWREVVASSTQDLSLAGGGTFGRLFRIHTTSRDLAFSDRLEDADALLAIVGDAVARTWTAAPGG